MTTWWSKTVLIGAVAAALLLPIGALGARFGLWGFSGGFLLLAVGAGLAVVMLSGGIPAAIIARRRGLAGDARACFIGLGTAALIIGVLGVQFQRAVSAPAIHNISTDVLDPPQFFAVAARRGQGTNPLEFAAEELAPLQAEHYPWVAPLRLAATPADAFAKVLAVLDGMGLEIVAQHPDEGLVEATATTFWFGFKDDVAVRVRADGAGALIDVRSVSRVGRSDLGANARRIGEILAGLSEG